MRVLHRFMKIFNAPLLLIFFFCCFIDLNAQQFPSNLWHPGELTLNDRTLLKGSLKYNFELETVQIQVGETTQTFDASQVLSFVFFDQVYKGRREIYSLPYATQSGYQRPKFFEVIVEGKMTFLVREYLVTQDSRNNPSMRSMRQLGTYGNLPMTASFQTYLAYNMYFVKEDGVIRESRAKKKDVIDQFDNSQALLKKYAKQEKLKLDRLEDIAKLVRYYNNETGN